ncbi:MAG: hypothetical protein HQL50_00910 [Magnetococcales bacterium]|nr:hypothetical protein [Magnetococcales bacterium]
MPYSQLSVHDLIIHIGLWLLFALQHSGMASERFKKGWCRLLGPLAAAERLLYNLISALCTSAILLHAYQFLPHTPLFRPEGYMLLTLFGVQFLGAMGMLAALATYDLARFSGFAALRAASSGENLPEEPFQIAWPHRFVRHPVYACGLLVIWVRPLDTAALILNLCATTYLIIGMRLEEGRLLTAYGEPYMRYRKQVPALIPLPGRSLPRFRAR